MRPLILIMTLLSACNADKSTDSGGTASDGGSDGGGSDDGGSATDTDSGGDGGSDGGSDSGSGDGGASSGLAEDIQAWISPDIVTVAFVSWTTAEESTGWVEFGATGSYGLQTLATAPGTEHQVILLGMPEETAIQFRVHVDGADGDVTSDNYSITTGSLPSTVPSVTVTGTADQWGYQVVPLQGTSFVVSIIDTQGRVVWYKELEGGFNLMRSLLSHDRKSVILCKAGVGSEGASGTIQHISIDGSSVVETPLPNVDHDIVELPDGTIGAIVVVTDPKTGKKADSIVELAADGTTSTIWSAWDHIDPTGLGLEAEANWTHGNGLDYYPDEDAYYLSMKAIGSLAKIDRATGETVWMINGKLNQFTFTEGSEMGWLQHQFERLPGGMLLFDNGLLDRGYSRAVEFEIDETTLTANEVWSYIRDPSVYVYAKGDVARFADGSTQVVWSSSGEIQNVTTEGEVTWQLNTELGQAITFVHVVDSLYEAD